MYKVRPCLISNHVTFITSGSVLPLNSHLKRFFFSNNLEITGNKLIQIMALRGKVLHPESSVLIIHKRTGDIINFWSNFTSTPLFIK